MAGGYPGLRPKLILPSYPCGGSEGIPYTIRTAEEKCVAEYAQMSMLAVMRLDIFSFWALLRDAVIFNRAGSPAGREWLQNAHRLIQTEPDLPALRQKFGKGG